MVSFLSKLGILSNLLPKCILNILSTVHGRIKRQGDLPTEAIKFPGLF